MGLFYTSSKEKETDKRSIAIVTKVDYNKLRKEADRLEKLAVKFIASFKNPKLKKACKPISTYDRKDEKNGEWKSIVKIENYLDTVIIKWDLWDYNSAPRTNDHVNDEFYDYLKKIFEYLKTIKLSSKDYSIKDDTGDWDGGSISLHYKDNHKIESKE